jgi:lipopolysaccharide transport system permease protein
MMASSSTSVSVPLAFDELPTLIIQPTKGWVGLRLGELWHARELVFFFTWREVKLRYKQTAVGIAWVVVQPLLNMIIFTLFFGRLAKMPSDGIPYPVFSMAGLVPWTFFANGVTAASNSLVGNANLVKRVYFSRLSVPISAVVSGLVDLGVSLILLLGMMPFYKVYPGVRIFWLPAFVLLALIAGLGVGLWLSAMNTEFRDVRYVVPFLIQFWMFATPIVYPSSLLPEPWRSIYGLNPMAGVVEGFRWCLLGSQAMSPAMLGVSTVASVGVLISGAFYFRRMERVLADVI